MSRTEPIMANVANTAMLSPLLEPVDSGVVDVSFTAVVCVDVISSRIQLREY